MASTTTEVEQEFDPNNAVLTPMLSERWMLGLEHVLVAIAAAVLFVVANSFPLRPTDLWGHVLYGQWILDHHALPAVDPYFPLAIGMPVVDSAWGSQVLFALIARAGGIEGLSLMFAVVSLAAYAVQMRVYFLQSGEASRPTRVLVSLAMTMSAIYIGWSRLSTIRPENFAMLLFAGLFWLLVGEEYAAPAGKRYRNLSLRVWIGVPLLFLVWANLHGSFVCGLGVLGCWFLGQLGETWWRSGSLRAALANRTVQGWLLLAELATLATCLNPYGPNLLLNVLFFANNTNLKMLLEWQTLAILGVGGRGFAFSWILLLVALRFSRAPLKLAHILTFAVFTVAAVSSIRMLGWYAVAACVLITPHVANIAAALVRRWEAAQPPVPDDELPPEGLLGMGYSFQFSLTCLGVVFIGFAWSPIGMATLWQTRIAPATRLGRETPLPLVAYLEKHPELLAPNSYCPQTWGDWLKYNLGDSFRPFMTSNVHLAPQQVWTDYNFIQDVQPGWQRVMDRYRLTVAIVDLVQQPGLAKVLRKDDGWQVLYEDEQAIILEKKPRSETEPDQPAKKQDPSAAPPGDKADAAHPPLTPPASASPVPPAANTEVQP